MSTNHRVQLLLTSKVIDRDELVSLLRDAVDYIYKKSNFDPNELEALIIDDMEDE